MATTLCFPSTNVFGRFLNDYLNGLPVIEIYSHYSNYKVVTDCVVTLTLREEQDEGMISIFLEDHAITRVACLVQSRDAYNDIQAYIKQQMDFLHEEGSVKIYGCAELRLTICEYSPGNRIAGHLYLSKTL